MYESPFFMGSFCASSTPLSGHTLFSRHDIWQRNIHSNDGLHGWCIHNVEEHPWGVVGVVDVIPKHDMKELYRSLFLIEVSSRLCSLFILFVYQQEILTDATKRCLKGLNRLQVVLSCLAGKLLGALISGGIGSLSGGEASNDLRSAVKAEVQRQKGSGRQQQQHADPPASAAGALSTAATGNGTSNGRTERDWLQSPLLANGLILPQAVGHNSRGSSSSSSGGGSLGAGITAYENGGMGPIGNGASESFLRDFVEGALQSSAAALHQWVSKHVGENPVLARTGGPLIARGVRGAAAAMLWHSGYAAAAQRMAAALAAAPPAARARVDSQVPPYFLLETWRKAAGLKSWAKSRRDRGTPYEATAAGLTRHCRFLLSLHPATGDRPVGWLVQEFKAFIAAAAAAAMADKPSSAPLIHAAAAAVPPAPAIPRRRSPSPSSRGLQLARSLSGGSTGGGGGGGSSGGMSGSGRRWGGGFPSVSEAGSGSLVRALETRHAERLTLVMGFLKGGVDLCRLRAAQLAADGRARRRAAGLTALRSLLGTMGREGSSGVKAALLLYVPPALRGVLHGLAALGPDPIALQVGKVFVS